MTDYRDRHQQTPWSDLRPQSEFKKKSRSMGRIFGWYRD